MTFSYGDAGHLDTRTERNGDVSTFTRNDLYQVTREVMAPGPGSHTPQWEHETEFDVSGNRRLLRSASGIAIYGNAMSKYGTSRFGVSGAETIWSVPEGLSGYDAMNRLKRFLDADGQATDFAHDAEGRRTSIAHPNGTITQASYDFLGRLLGLVTSRNGIPLLSLAYRYDRNGNRVRQIADNTTFDYRLDEDDRLVGESINCLGVKTAQELRKGTTSGTDTARRPGRLILLGWDNRDDASDTFAGPVLDLDRWRPVMSETNLSGFRLRQDDGLELLFPEGFTDRVIYQDTPVRSTYGLSTSDIWCGMEHRRTLAGDFHVEVDFDSLQQVTSALNGVYGRVRVGLLVNAQPAELRAGPLAAVYRTVDPATLGDVWESQIQPTSPPATIATGGASGATAGSLRIQRVSGQLSTWFRPPGGAWTQLGAATVFAGDGLHVALLLETAYAPGTVRFRNFVQVGQENYPATGTYESEVYDSGQDGTVWGTLTWTESMPTGTDVVIDVATQDSVPFGTWNYTGGYTDASGSSLAGRTGRYLRFRATLTGGASTPEASDLRITFGTGWQDRSYGFDSRGNMTSKEVVSASGVVSEARSFNSLNQITQNVVTDGGTTTWLYTWVDGQGRNSGNLLQKRKSDNSEIWDYTWDEDNRLTRVVKTVNSVIVLDVSYTYDSLGRMLTRKLSTDTNPTRFAWDGWDLVREVDPAGVETVYYAPEGEIPSFKRGSSVYQVHADALGSVRRVSDSSGGSAAAFDFDAWGNVIGTSGSVASSVTARYVGAYGTRADIDTALTYMRHRWYDPALGRFLSRDPRRIGISDNLYIYGLNNPTLLMDPSGEFVSVEYDRKSETVTATDYNWNPETKRWEVAGVYTFENVVSGDISARHRSDMDHVRVKGPVPAGTYYIGPLTDVSPAHPDLSGDVMWLPLLDPNTMENVHRIRRPDGTISIRDQFYIHPGFISQGCITFTSETLKDKKSQMGYPWSSAYDKLRSLILKSDPITVTTPWDESGYGSVPQKTHIIRGRVIVR